MAADHFAALVNAHSRGRSVRAIAEEAELPLHYIQRYMKPRFELTKMPTTRRMVELATALGAPYPDVLEAFAADLVDKPAPDEVVVPRREAELTALFRRLSPPYQETLLAMAKSLSHLERSVAHDGTPDLGDGRSAM